MIVMSLHMTSGRPPAADGTWMQGPLVRHLIFKALRCILNACSIQPGFFTSDYYYSSNRGWFGMCVLFYVLLDSQYITHRLASVSIALHRPDMLQPHPSFLSVVYLYQPLQL